MHKTFKIRFQNFRRLFYTGLFIIYLVLAAYPQRQERKIESWQPLHFDINLTFDYGLSQINSATTDVTILIRQNEVTKIDFDFGTMPVSAVKINNEMARFAQHDEKLDVFLTQPTAKDQKLNVSVTYSGVPQDGLILKKDRDGNPSAVGDNWADRVHNWIPCLDHPSAKASVRFTVTASSNNLVVANGVLESSKSNPDTTKTWIFNES